MAEKNGSGTTNNEASKVAVDQIEQLDVKLQEIKSELDSKEKELKATTDNSEQLDVRLQAIKRELDSKNKELKSTTGKITENKRSIENGSKQLATLEKQCEETTQRHTLLADELKKLQDTHERNEYLQTMLTQEHKKNEKKKKTVEELNKKYSDLEKENKEHTEQIAALSKDLQTKTDQHNHYKLKMEEALGKMNTNLQTQQMTVRARESTIATQTTEYAKLQQYVEQLQDEIKTLTANLQETDSLLQKERIDHYETQSLLTQQMDNAERMNSQLIACAREKDILQDEVNKAKGETLQLKIQYRDLPHKEAQFQHTEANNKHLREENAELKEQIKDLMRLQTTITFLRDQNENLAMDNEKLKERHTYTGEKFRGQMDQYEQQTREVQTLTSDRLELRHQLKQKKDENEALKQRLQQIFNEVENLKKDLSESASELMVTRSQLHSITGDSILQTQQPQMNMFGRPSPNESLFHVSPGTFNIGTNASSTPRQYQSRQLFRQQHD